MQYCPKCRYPHPNCKCYAEGGEVSSIPGFIPDESFVPDEVAIERPIATEGFIPDSDFISDEERYGSTGQQIITALEGAAEGIAGPLATAAERALGVPPEDILRRRETNPWTHGISQVGGLLTGAGVIGPLGALAGRAAAGTVAATKAAPFAAAALRTGAELAVFQASDELSRMLMNDPKQSLETAVADVGLASLLGAGGGALFKAAGAATEKSEGFLSEFVGRLKSRLGTATAEGAQTTAAETAGSKFADALLTRTAKRFSSEALGTSAGAAAGHMTGIPGAAVLGAIVGEHTLSPLLEKMLPTIAKPMLERTLSSQALKAAAEYGRAVVRGEKALKSIANATLHGGRIGAIEGLSVDEKRLNRLDETIANFEKEPDRLFELGGELGHYLPDHAASLSERALNVIEYLAERRPKDASGLPLDDMEKPNDFENYEWKRTLMIAENPLITMKFLSDGELNHEDVVTFQTLYPSLYQTMKVELTASLIEAKSKNVEVPYPKRIALSLFMGEPLDSTMEAMSIQSIQSTFSTAKAKLQQPQQSGSTSKLKGVSELSQTPLQSREKRQLTKG